MSSEDVRLSKGVVAILDRLGTKGIWNRANQTKVVESWEAVLGFFSEAVAQHEADGGDWGPIGRPQPHVAAFSDTIILTVEGDDPPRFLPLLFTLIAIPFTKALMQEVFFRGVFSIGEFYRTQSLVVGPAVDEAAQWYEQPNWLGISAAPSAAFGIERLLEQGGDVSPWFARYDIPTREGAYRDGWALAWPKLMTNRPLSGRVITDRGLLLEMFSRNPVGPDILPKFQHTIAFLDHVLAQQANRDEPQA